jgi:hypothetical protein
MKVYGIHLDKRHRQKEEAFRILKAGIEANPSR